VGTGARATTDDLGHLRLCGLPAGEFYVSASYTFPAQEPVPIQRPGEPRYGFAPTFYPSAAGLEGARTVSLRVGQETGGIDVSLVRAKLGSVSGRVADAAGAPLTERQVGMMLMSRRDAMGGTAPGASRWRENGTFVFSNVPPGRYLLAANVLSQAPSSGPAEAGFELVAADGDAADAWIVVFPEHSSRWFPGSPSVGVLQTRPATRRPGRWGRYRPPTRNRWRSC
jgi:hypothetical protein